MVSQPFTLSLGQDDEISALIQEAQSRGINIGPALSLSTSRDELLTNLKARLAAESRPEVQALRAEAQARTAGNPFLSALFGQGERPTPEQAFYGAPGTGLGANPLFQTYINPSVTEDLPEPLQQAVGQVANPIGTISAVASPLRTAGAVAGSVAAQQVAKKAGAGPVVQNVAGLAGGIVGGAPELAAGAGRLAVRGGSSVVGQVRPVARQLLADERGAIGGLPEMPVQPPSIEPAAPVPVTAEPADPVGHVIDLLRTSKNLRPTVEQTRAAQLRLGVERGSQAAKAEPTPLGRSRAFLQGQSGLTTRGPQFEPVAEAKPGVGTSLGLPDVTPTEAAQQLGVTPDHFGQMFTRIEARLSPNDFDTVDAQRGLIRLLTGETATPRQVRLLDSVFGKPIVDVAAARGGKFKTIGSVAYDVGFLLPRALRSSWDASAPLRQMVIYTLNPRPSRLNITKQAFADMLKVGFVGPGRAEGAATKIYNGIVDRAQNKWAEQLYSGPSETRLFLQDVNQTTLDFSAREEYFASTVASDLKDFGSEFKTAFRRPVPPVLQAGTKITTFPVRAIGAGVRRSELMFATYMNEVKNAIATRTLDEWQRAGIDITQANADALKRGINIFSGRGYLGPAEGLAKYMAVGFWSPRLAISRFEAPFVPLRGIIDPSVRLASKELAKDLVAFTTTGLGILAFLDKMGWANIEADPRSPDFGKVRVGNLTYDFWGGFQQPARYTTQIMTGTRKTITGEQAGKITTVGSGGGSLRKEALESFLRSKLSPGAPTLAGNELFGRTYNQEILNPTKKQQVEIQQGVRRSPARIRESELANQYVPLFAQDLENAVQQSGAQTIANWFPGSLGVGVQSLSNTTVQAATGSNLVWPSR